MVSHGWGICTDVEPQSEMEKVLYAIDELTGLVVTTALVRPSKSVLDMKPKSVKKKWKDKRFAAGVNRSIIEKGAEMLGVQVSDLIVDTIDRHILRSEINPVDSARGLRSCLVDFSVSSWGLNPQCRTERCFHLR